MGELRAGLIGANIQKTRLPFALKALCELNGLEFSFELMDTALIQNFNFEHCVNECISKGWTGVTVTHPFKTAAADFVGTLSGAPATMGASNTLIFKEPKSATNVMAYNTDYTGFVAAWQSAFGDRKPGKVAMAGAGGVSRAIAVALIELGAEQLAIWDLKPQQAEQVAALADPCGKTAIAVPIEASENYVRAANGLVNATALGMAPYPGMAFNAEHIGSQKWAFDAIYTPIWTDFMKNADSKGLKCLTGFDLFKHMATRTFTTYTRLKVDRIDADRVIDPLADGI